MESGSRQSFLGDLEGKKHVVFDKDIFSPNRLKQSCIMSLISWTCLIFEGEYSIVRLLLFIPMF